MHLWTCETKETGYLLLKYNGRIKVIGILVSKGRKMEGKKGVSGAKKFSSWANVFWFQGLDIMLCGHVTSGLCCNM